MGADHEEQTPGLADVDTPPPPEILRGLYDALAWSGHASWCIGLKPPRFLHRSPLLTQQWGWPAGDAPEAPQAWLARIHPDDRERVLHAFVELQHGAAEETTLSRFRVVDDGGAARWLRVRAARLHGGAGETQGFTGVSVDITDRVREEQAARRRDAILQAIGFVAERFLESSGLCMDMEDVLDRLGRAVDADRVYLFENHAGPEGALAASLRFEWSAEGAAPHRSPDQLENVVYDAAGYGRWRKALEAGEFIKAQRSELPGEEQRLVAAEGVESLLVMPVFVGASWWGLLGFCDLHSGRDWNDGELDALRMAASLMGAALLAVENDQALRQAEERYRTVADFTYNWEYWLGPDGSFQYISPACERVTGYRPDEFLRGPSLLLHIVHPDDREAFEAHLRETAERREPRSLDFRIIARNGEERWIGHTCQPVMAADGRYLGHRASNRDITAYMQAQHALQESEERLRLLIEGSEDLICLHDLEGRYLYYSGPSRYGLTQADLAGKTPLDLFGEEAAPIMQQIEQVGRTGEKLIVENSLTWEGRPLWFSDHVYAVHGARGAISGVARICRNITDQRRTERVLHEMSRMEAVASLAGGVAHLLNNQMAVVMGNVEIARDQVLAGEACSECLAEIEEAARRAGRLAHQLVAYARGGKYEPARLDVNDLIGELLMIQSDLFSDAVEVRFAPGAGPAWVEADRSQLSQVVLALCANAAEAIDGRGEVQLVTKRVAIDAAEAEQTPEFKPGAYVCLSVSDTGCGMPPEALERAFEPFYTTKFLGRGLGLAAAYGIVRNHGGYIMLESEPGRGTQAHVYLPAAAPAKPVPSALEALPRGAETVLLADDEPILVKVTTRVLEGLGYTVLIARNGREAVDLAKTHDGPIDLILLDILMPVMGGRQALPLLRTARPETPVVIFSGHEPADAGEALMNSGAAAFLRKPATKEQLAHTLRRILDQRTHAADGP